MIHPARRSRSGLLVVCRLIPVMTAALLSGRLHATDFIVAPTGKSTGTGTAAAPWDLLTALKHPAALKPGDTLLLRGGTYPAPDRLVLHSYLAGAPGAYITVRPYATEHAIVDGGIQVHGPWVTFRDLEIMNSRTTRQTSQAGPFPSDVVQPPGVDVLAANVRVINNIIHDTSTGVSSWRQASENEFYGNVIYYNGWKGPDRAHGHGAYMQNQYGKKYITDNIFFSQFEYGLQLYGTSSTYLNGLELDGNIVFNSGQLGGAYSRNILLGGTVIANNPVLRNNYTYFPASWNHGGDNNVGYYMAGAGCSNLTMEKNYFVSGGIALTRFPGSVKSLTGNTFFGETRAWDPAAYPGNTVLQRNRPASNRVFVRPNRYEAGRSHVAVFNWTRAASVAVDLSGTGLVSGDSFEVRDAQNYFGVPVFQGVYTGAAVSIPMTSTAVAQPIGNVPYAPVHSDMEFNAFVVMKTGASVPKPPPPVQPPPPVIVPLSISGASASSVTSSSALVQWTTNVAASTDVEFGTTTALGLHGTGSSALTTYHAVSLTGLAPSTTYYTRVFSRDAAGQTAELRTVQFKTAAAPVPSVPPASVYSYYMEAENGPRVQFPITSDLTVSGRKYITAATAETGSVVYNVYTPVAGTFTFWFRALARDAQTASLYVSVNGGPEDVFDIAWQKWSPSWQWSRINGRNESAPLAVNPRTFVLKAGWHKLTIRSRQAGTMIDGFVITNDLSLVPTDLTFGRVPR